MATEPNLEDVLKKLSEHNERFDDLLEKLSEQDTRLEELDKAVRQRNEAFAKAEDNLAVQLKDYGQKVQEFKALLADTQRSLGEHKSALEAARGARGIGWAMVGLVTVALIVLICQFWRMDDRIELIQDRLVDLPDATVIKGLCSTSACNCSQVWYMPNLCDHVIKEAGERKQVRTRKKKSWTRGHGCQNEIHSRCDHSMHGDARGCLPSLSQWCNCCTRCGIHPMPLKADTAHIAPESTGGTLLEH